jgi:hypothetical protein
VKDVHGGTDGTTLHGVDQQILAWQKEQASKAFYRQPRQISYPHVLIPSPDLFVGTEDILK